MTRTRHWTMNGLCLHRRRSANGTNILHFFFLQFQFSMVHVRPIGRGPCIILLSVRSLWTVEYSIFDCQSGNLLFCLLPVMSDPAQTFEKKQNVVLRIHYFNSSFRCCVFSFFIYIDYLYRSASIYHVWFGPVRVITCKRKTN